MTSLPVSGKDITRMIRNAVVSALTVFGLIVFVVALINQDTAGWQFVTSAAVGAMAFANLEISGRPWDEGFRKLAPLFLTAAGSWLALFVEIGEERARLIVVLSYVISITLSVFAIQFMCVILWRISRDSKQNVV